MDQIRAAWVAFLAAFSALVMLLVNYYWPGGTVTPVPSASPSVTSSASVQFSDSWDQKPMPGVTLNFIDASNIRISHNETVGLIGKKTTTDCIQGMEDSNVKTQLFEMATITTTKPSYIGAPVGALYDPLIPRDQICQPGIFWLDLTAKGTALSGPLTINVGSAQLNLTIYKMVMPAMVTMPLYISLGPFAVLLGHNLDRNSSVAVQGPLGMKYNAALRANRIEPYAQTNAPYSISGGQINLDQFAPYGSPKQVLLDGRLAPPMLADWSTDPNAAGPAIENLIKSQNLQGAWAYVWDEPDASVLGQVAARAQLYKQLAPDLKTMSTTQPNATLSPVLDIFVGVMAWFGQSGRAGAADFKPGYWLYEACMAHGCGGSVGNLTGSPDLASVDAPSIHSRVYPLMAYALGASGAIYYNTVEAYSQMDPWQSIYLFNGNGDGTLFYPGRPGEHGLTEHQPITSIRLKLMRTGMFDIEYAAMAKRAGLLGTKLSSLIQDTHNWSKDYSAYQALRNGLGDAMNGQ